MPTKIRTFVAALAATLLIGGCSNMNPADPAKVDNPLTHSQARAQVIEPLKDLVKTLNLDVRLASLSYDSCDDQGDPPNRARSSASFTPAEGADPDALKQRIHDTLIGSMGWLEGPPPGKSLFGLNVHKGQVMAVISVNDNQSNIPGTVAVDIYGECRDMTVQGPDKAIEDPMDELTAAR